MEQTMTPQTECEKKAYDAATRDFYDQVGNALLWGRVSNRCKEVYVARQREMIAAYAEIDAIAYEQGI